MVKRQPIEKNNKDKFLDQINFSLADQDYQIKMVQFADNKYQNKEISLDEYIKFWETLWERTGLIFEGVGWRFELAHLYILANRLEDALTFVKFIKSKSDSYTHAWNDKVPDRIFPVKGNIIESIASKVNLFSGSSSNNVLLAKDVQIYGVATEFVKNL